MKRSHDRQHFNSNDSTPSSSSDDDKSESSSHEQHPNSDSIRLDHIVNYDPGFSSAHIIYNCRPGSGESDDSFHAGNRSPNSGHGDEWGGIEDTPMYPNEPLTSDPRRLSTG